MANRKQTLGIMASIMVFGSVLVGCEVVTGLSNDNELATVRVSLPQNKARAVDLISIDDAIAMSDTFDLKVIRTSGSGGTWSASATNKDTFIEMQMPVGTYNFILTAGKTSSLLMATGYVKDREITLGAINSVDITLLSVDITVEAPSSVEIGADFEATVTVNFKNPFISSFGAPNLTISSSADPAKFTSFNMNNTSTTEEDGIYTYTYAHISPAYAGEAIISFYYDVDDSINGEYDWYIRNSDLLNTPINFYEGSGIPQIEINVSWGDN
ncbi:MAG: hypothetical protein LBI40_03380 [Treponema sp.]|jgi:hypothetical protein|nr:hypothetical protein [Treponema sp.]